MKLKALIPKSLRLTYQILRRRWRDARSSFVFATAKTISRLPSFSSVGLAANTDWAAATPMSTTHFPNVLSFRQPILHATTNFGKVENMRLAGAALSKVVVQPNEVLSFWRIVGNPSAKRGYQKSRNLVNGALQEDYGGGLCQVSGILYYAALSAGLKVIERYPHSVDIYAENERFVPLGGDATVVFGYKDVRIQNSTDAPIVFYVHVEDNHLVCELRSLPPLSKLPLNFEREDAANRRKVVTKRQNTEGGAWEVLAVSEYKIL